MSDTHKCFVDFYNATGQSPQMGAEELLRQVGQSPDQKDIREQFEDHIGILGASFVSVLGDQLVGHGFGQQVAAEQFTPGGIFEISPPMRTAINLARSELGFGK